MNALTFVKKHWFLTLFVLVIGILTLAFLAGYRPGPYGLPVKAGTLTVQNAPDGANIFIDSTRRHVVKNGRASLQLAPGTHTVIVDYGTSYPWNELVTITSDKTTTVTPLFVNSDTKAAQVEEARIAEATRALATRALPTKAAPLTLDNGCLRFYVSGTRILGEAGTEGCVVPEYLACTEEAKAEFGACLPTVIFESGDTLESVLPYPGRTDALILASGNLVYVLEIDPRDPRFFAPLIKGPNVRAAAWSETSIITTGAKGPRVIPL